MARPDRWAPLAWVVALVACFGAAVAYQRVVRAYGLEGSKRPYATCPPLYADPHDEVPPAGRVIAATAPGGVALALALVALRLDRRWATALLVAAAPALVAWQNLSAAAIDAPDAWRRPFTRVQLEYLGDVQHVRRLGPAGFVRDYPKLIRARDGLLARFVDPFKRLSLHGATHPPGGALVLWAGLTLWGDPPVDFAARRAQPHQRLTHPAVVRGSAVAVGLSALAVLGTAGVAWLTHGRSAAAIAVALHVATPAFVWFGATSMDGVFLLGCVPVLVLFEWSLRARATPDAAPPARFGFVRVAMIGIALGASAAIATFLTFAAAMLAVLFAVRLLALLAVDRRAAARGALACGVGLVAWLAIQGALRLTVGYDVVDNVRASYAVDQRHMGTGHESLGRYADVGVANAVAFAIGCGGATVAVGLCAAGRGVANLARRRPSAADAAAVAWPVAVALVAASTLFTLEVERIWTFLMVPGLAVAAGEFARPSGWARYAVVATATVALSAQTVAMEAWLYTWW